MATNSKECDLDVILNGINANLNDIDIVKQLPNITSDNLYSVINGIKAVRNQVPVNEKLAFQKHFTSLLLSFGFDFDKMLNCSKAHYKAKNYADYDDLLIDIVEMFCKWCKSRNFDIIDILLS